jgi:predicted DNA-binding transcriptional regulator YafY
MLASSAATPQAAGRVNRRTFLRAAWFVTLAFGASAGLASSPSAIDVVREGIRRQRSIRLRYAGHMRLVEPHAIGLTPGGHRALLAWQVEGGSRSDPPTGWRTFVLSEISDAALTVRGFTPHATYHPERANLREIELEVSRPPDGASTNPPARGRD